MSDRPEAQSWTIKHFSMANPVGTKRDDVALLMRRVADSIEARGPMQVQDVTFGTEVTAEGLVHDFTVYFHPLGDDGEPIDLD
jgi:hypothetical protein